MKIYTLQATCEHNNVEPWKWTGDQTEHWFCHTCYARLIRYSWEHIEADVPVTGLCEHRGNKTPLAQHTTNQEGPRALCMECGCAVEHPDGPGSWEEVLFNGLLIQEE